MRPTMQMVFQDPQASLNPRMTVEDIIEEPLDEHTRLSDSEKRAKVAELMDQVGLNRKFAKRYPHAFSGGQRQRAWIAMTLAQEGHVLLLDEPTTYLDLAHQVEVLRFLRRLVITQGVSVVAVLHGLNQAARYADRVVLMRAGTIVAAGPPAEVLTAAAVSDVFGLDVTLLHDPETQTPVIVPKE